MYSAKSAGVTSLPMAFEGDELVAPDELPEIVRDLRNDLARQRLGDATADRELLHVLRALALAGPLAEELTSL